MNFRGANREAVGDACLAGERRGGECRALEPGYSREGTEQGRVELGAAHPNVERGHARAGTVVTAPGERDGPGRVVRRARLRQ